MTNKVFIVTAFNTGSTTECNNTYNILGVFGTKQKAQTFLLNNMHSYVECLNNNCVADYEQMTVIHDDFDCVRTWNLIESTVL